MQEKWTSINKHVFEQLVAEADQHEKEA